MTGRAAKIREKAAFVPADEPGEPVVSSCLRGLPDSGKRRLLDSFAFQRVPFDDSDELSLSRSGHTIFLGLYRC